MRAFSFVSLVLIGAVLAVGSNQTTDIKKSFGRTPDSYIGRHAERPDKHFSEIYWRMDVRLEEDAPAVQSA